MWQGRVKSEETPNRGPSRGNTIELCVYLAQWATNTLYEAAIEEGRIGGRGGSNLKKRPDHLGAIHTVYEAARLWPVQVPNEAIWCGYTHGGRDR